jgi:hypothetical protein
MWRAVTSTEDAILADQFVYCSYSVTVHSMVALGVEVQLHFFLTQALDGD